MGRRITGCGYAFVIVMLVRNNIKGGVRDTSRHVSLDNIYLGTVLQGM